MGELYPLLDKVESWWKSYAHLFNLDPQRYEAPWVKSNWFIGRYNDFANIMEIMPIFQDFVGKHETRHKITFDATRQFLQDVAESRDEKLLSFISDRYGRVADSLGKMGRDQRMFREDFLRSHRRLENNIPLASTFLNQDGSTYYEAIVHAFDENEFHGKNFMLIPVLVPGSMGMLALYSANETVSSVYQGTAWRVALHLGLTTISVYGAFRAGDRRFSDTRSKINKLKVASPEIRRYHALGPMKNESLDDFAAELDRAGALKF